MLKSRDWTQAELARRAGVSRTAISYIISGKAKVGNSLCSAFARAFRIPPEDVFRKAGLLPPPPQADDNIREIEHIYDHLDEASRSELVEYARLRLKIQEKRGDYQAGPKEA